MTDLRLLLCLIVLFAASLPGCGGGGSSTPPAPDIAVSISPPAKQLQAGFSLQFTAEVTGTSNTAVVWQVNGVASGNASVGKITAGGLYTAPETVPNPATLSVSAVAQADVSKFASASITITAPVAVSISPVSSIVAASGQQQFSAVVSNNSNTAVDWEVNGVVGGNANLGTISNAGLYIAPNQASNVSISAVSHADLSKSASASLVVLAPHRFGYALQQQLLNSSIVAVGVRLHLAATIT